MRPLEDEKPAARPFGTMLAKIAKAVGARGALPLGRERQFCFDWAPSTLSSRRTPPSAPTCPRAIYPEKHRHVLITAATTS